ncbi:hypothetical protein ADIMK_2080 [Marinobacterium lacunae]|uniref:Uncharacterized protein n=1 Tax=Marinobacterium lacunae TaxID=1232683 RepID=A0A081FZ23_9GAMM|nr:hypothetical protein [Marinobacterium lacunae]KEA63778.1 hypothetical protein ADIMK_2080 [Marinobacterium lacunae]MBR9882456.1 hypothetical protein [Oceanospirillales bacterium]
MMIAELIDLEDFTDRLRELGLALPVGADATAVKAELEDWLGDASSEELNAFERMVATLEAKSGGMMLPIVVALIAHGRGLIEHYKN